MTEKKRMILKYSIVIVVVLFVASSVCVAGNGAEGQIHQSVPDSGTNNSDDGTSVILLPVPDHSGMMTLDTALQERRSVREYQNASLSIKQLSNLLWAAQGITDPKSGKRTAPSGQMIYPLTFHLAITSVEGLPAGVYRYNAPNQTLVREFGVDKKDELKQSLGKNGQSAPVTIIITGNYSLYEKFGKEMADQSIYLEAGHAAQNFLLELTAEKLAGVPFSGFNPDDLGKILELDTNERAIYGIRCGVPK